ncbi:MAG: hypothetical protein NTW86_13880 [Candidatus Sumerlaeota bacterium]|nr:hypothetical protein [Candidatus Sumerlaeota bacterium]
MDVGQPKRCKRRRLLVIPRFQLRLVGSIWLFVLAGMAIATVGTCLYFLLLNEPSHADVVQGWSGMVGRTALALLVLFGLMAWGTLLVSHRIAGPIYRILRVLEDLQRDKSGAPIRFRRGDAFQDVARQLNHTLHPLEARRERKDTPVNIARSQALQTVERLRAELNRLASIEPADPVEPQAVEHARRLCSELTEIFR